MYFFDYYQCSVSATPDEVFAAIKASKMAVGYKDEDGYRNYESSRSYLDRDGSCHIQVMWGGNPGVNIRGSGHCAEGISKLVRKNWPKHKVSRVDVACDVRDAGSYVKFRDIAIGVARDVKPKPVSTTEIADPTAPLKGSTLYLGGLKSPVRLRIYQKGFEQFAKALIKEGEIDENWTRAEFQIKPRTRDKAKFAHLGPEECIGYSKWGRAFMLEIAGIEIERVERDEGPAKYADEKTHYAAVTYSKAFMTAGILSMIYDHGVVEPKNSDAIEAVLDQIRQVLKDLHPDDTPFVIDRKELLPYLGVAAE